MDTREAADERVLVVGGGIGGLATALALTRSGKTVTVVEQASKFGEIGAGLQLGPNATRVLGSWDLMRAVAKVCVVPKNLVMRDALSGEVVTRFPLGKEFQERFGGPYVVIHRSDLHAILLNACQEARVTLLTDTCIDRVESTDRGTTATGADGRHFHAAVTVGADGLRSALRGHIVGDELVSSGYVAYRGTLPIDQVPERDRDLDDVVVWAGPHCHLVQYRLRSGTVLNQVAVFESPSFLRGEVDSDAAEELDTAFAECQSAVQDAIGFVDRQRRWPLYDRPPAQNWGSGRVVLAGDAAHPMLQYLAQGCCQALEDAKTLESLVKKTAGTATTDWSTVINRYSASRIRHAAEVQTKARLFGDLCHARGVHRAVRNELLARLDPSALYDFADWLYRGPLFEPALDNRFVDA